MKPLFHPSLINGPFDDPGLYIDFLFDKRAILFDLGDLRNLPPRKILRVSHVFVSHTHIDHFIGFDQVLRVLLAREKLLHMYGPPGFIDRVGHRLASYTWNLVENYCTDFMVVASEFDGGPQLRSARFRCRGRFEREETIVSAAIDGILLDEETFRVRSVLLDHKTPCLAFALEEKNHVNIMKNLLTERGLPVGPWLTELKTAVLRGDADHKPFRVWWREGGETRELFIPLGTLKKDILRVVPGQKISYVTDAVGSAGNSGLMVELARDSDYMFIEAMFLREDEARAREKHHLTAPQAGLMARQAGAKRVIPFHFSPKYIGREDLLRQEVVEAFEDGNLPGCNPG